VFSLKNLSARTKQRLLYGGIVGISVLGAGVLLHSTGWLEPLELLTYDARFLLRGTLKADDRILLLTIDEDTKNILRKNIKAITRSDYAHAIANLSRAGARLIAVDMDLSKSSYSDDQVQELETVIREMAPFLQGRKKSADKKKPISDAVSRVVQEPDAKLAEAIGTTGNVILIRFVDGGKWVAPLPIFQEKALAQGAINFSVDRDGKIRGVPTLMTASKEETEGIFFTLGLETAIQDLYMGNVPEPATPSPGILAIGKLRVPMPTLNINYIGPPRSYPSLSFGRSVLGQFSPSQVKGKIILVGNTHPTSHDFYPTPFTRGLSEEGEAAKMLSGQMTSGVEIHANILQTILSGNGIRRWDKTERLLLTGILGAAAAILLVVLNLSTWLRSLILLAFMAGEALAAQRAFTGGIWLDIVGPQVGIILSFVAGIVLHRALDAREKARITQTFGLYVSPSVVQEIIRRPEAVRLGGEKRVLSVLFSDVRGFTAVSEVMEPEALVSILNVLLTAMTRVIFQHGGVVDKFIGDAVMALFGAPLPTSDHALKGCLAALAMQEALRPLREQWLKEGKPRIEMGVGVNTGTMTLGNMGSDQRFDYTVIGDSVNLASRLEGLNKQYGTGIIISEATLQAAGDGLVARELDRVRVKGKKDPVRIFELLGRKGDVQALEPLISRFSEGLRNYRERCFNEAREIFQSILKDHEDGPSKLYIERCTNFITAPPPPEWDGLHLWDVK